jgi:hypothetical protein
MPLQNIQREIYQKLQGRIAFICDLAPIKLAAFAGRFKLWVGSVTSVFVSLTAKDV